jgi:hypothetical protein
LMEKVAFIKMTRMCSLLLPPPLRFTLSLFVYHFSI